MQTQCCPGNFIIEQKSDQGRIETNFSSKKEAPLFQSNGIGIMTEGVFSLPAY
jgi:hypothetical protein